MTADGMACLIAGCAIGVLFRKELFDAGYRLGENLGNFIVRWILR